ncbi:MAG: response regulator transcription factor, partial [Thermodesulfobacteriota bacterium]
KKGILIVDEHPLFREGLKAIVARNGKFEVLGEAGQSLAALRLAVELKPDLVLIGISAPDHGGIELTKALRRYAPHTALLILSVNSATTYVADSFAAGAAAYVLKDCLPETLLHALDVVSQGGYFLDGPVSGETVNRLKAHAGSHAQTDLSRYESLTRRQKQVLQLLVRGLSHKAIAQKLCISPRTVEGHRNEIMRNLDLLNTVELTRYALGAGLLEADGDDL